MKEKQASILIVDDNPVTLRLLASTLSHAGYAVLEATGGNLAMEVLKNQSPDLILLDIDMPGVSGLEICRLIKKSPKTADIPVLFITASDAKQDIVAGFAAGGQDYIIKPSTKEELLARVNTHLTLCHTQQALRASRAKYKELSYLDDLTGLYNTRYLYKTLEAQLEKAPATPLTVVFIDIDKFKQVVDGHGHLHGSRAIAELAGIIRHLLPKGSFGVSYGGDEFVLVLVNHDESRGMKLAERIRQKIADTPFLESQGISLSVTVSCGLSCYPDDARTMVDLLGNADQALFATKRRGRNAVIAFSEIQQSQETEHFLPVDETKYHPA